jgi:hypothetical protein
MEGEYAALPALEAVDHSIAGFTMFLSASECPDQFLVRSNGGQR